MTTTSNYRNRSGQDINVGDVVDVLSFDAEGVEGGTVVGFRKVSKIPVAVVRQASGREVRVWIKNVVPR